MRHGICKLRRLDNGKYTRRLGPDAWNSFDGRYGVHRVLVEAMQFCTPLKEVDAFIVFECGCYTHDVRDIKSLAIKVKGSLSESGVDSWVVIHRQELRAGPRKLENYLEGVL